MLNRRTAYAHHLRSLLQSNVHACKGILVGVYAEIASAGFGTLRFQRTRTTITFLRRVNDRALIHLFALQGVAIRTTKAICRWLVMEFRTIKERLFALIVHRTVGRHISLNQFT